MKKKFVQYQWIGDRIIQEIPLEQAVFSPDDSNLKLKILGIVVREVWCCPMMEEAIEKKYFESVTEKGVFKFRVEQNHQIISAHYCPFCGAKQTHKGDA